MSGADIVEAVTVFAVLVVLASFIGLIAESLAGHVSMTTGDQRNDWRAIQLARRQRERDRLNREEQEESAKAAAFWADNS